MPKPLLIFLLLFAAIAGHKPDALPDSKLATDVRNNVWPHLLDEMHGKDIADVKAIYIRIFKEEHVLEIWVKGNKRYQLFKTYPICFFSGGLGTKTRENDGKSPEGFYTITAGQLNPVSNYHLAMNIGYPNSLEKAKGYTGSAIMIHGHCASIGCYAMTDPYIEEIYTMAYKALKAGQQRIPLHIFPFRMNTKKLNSFSGSNVYPFWKNIKLGYNMFERSHVPPVVYVDKKKYAFKED
jgi:murein L,D-transpeptidase YafK